MKRNKQIYTIQTPAVTEQFAKSADAAFPFKQPKPGMSLEEIMENAGERKVVEWIKRQAVGKSGIVNRG